MKGRLLGFDDVTLIPTATKIKSRSEVDLIGPRGFIPLMASSMDTVGTNEASWVMQELNAFTLLHHSEVRTAKNSALSISVDTAIIDVRKASYVNVDTANGYLQVVKDRVALLRQALPDLTIIAGNVVTAEGVYALGKAGADIVRVGIGNGQHCLTTPMTGVGVPQFDALLDCRFGANAIGCEIASDGGHKNPGDVVKAFVAGADYVILGTPLAAHIENTNPKNINKHGEALVYGMASQQALDLYYGGVKSYRTPEGRASLIPMQGHLKDTVNKYLAGIRSACTYLNAKSIMELKNARWERV